MRQTWQLTPSARACGRILSAFLFLVGGLARAEGPLELAGMSVTPHVQSAAMRYRRAPDPELGARVQLFLRNASAGPLAVPASVVVRFRGQTPDELLKTGDWAWHDTPAAWPGEMLSLPPGAMTVWTFNSRRANWGVATRADLTIEWPGQPPQQIPLVIDAPAAWLSAVTFLGDSESPFPDRMICHVTNASGGAMRLTSARLWLPESNASWRSLIPQSPLEKLDAFAHDGTIPGGDQGGARVTTCRLPLTYAAVEVRAADASGRPASLWAHLRVKREVFDISGGWVASRVKDGNALQHEPFLKTLARLHVNTAHIGHVAGYTDNPALYAKYPLKLFNKLDPVTQFDTDEMLPRIHAVEFLGEPQYGGGRPVPPMDVWRALAPYQKTRLPTTVTHSEERIWRYYAGLSDYPHYDAYRVTAPSPDAWGQYDRWDGQRIRWGAPLETIGDMTRSLRDLNRPAPIAYWSQGAHAGWDSYGGRRRTSPTPDELRLQAYHALSSRITSLYWFNLSPASVVKFRDLIEPMTRAGREIRLLDSLYLEGSAYEYRRIEHAGRPDWDLASVAGPDAALLFALDLAYRPDPDERVFRFGGPREARFAFRLPAYLQKPAEVFRIDADGDRDVRCRATDNGVEIADTADRVVVYVAARSPGLRARLSARVRELAAREASLQFDPARNDDDFHALRQLVEKPSGR